MNARRLLPSIVFASASLLAIEALHAEEATCDPKIDAASDAGAPRDAAPDRMGDKRTCEQGWPTTKGQICDFHGGLICCRRHDEPPSAAICCPKK